MYVIAQGQPIGFPKRARVVLGDGGRRSLTYANGCFSLGGEFHRTDLARYCVDGPTFDALYGAIEIGSSIPDGILEASKDGATEIQDIVTRHLLKRTDPTTGTRRLLG